MKLLRYYDPAHGAQIGVEIDGVIHNISAHYPMISAWLRSSTGRPLEAIAALSWLAQDSEVRFSLDVLENPPALDKPHYLPPVDEQDVWAAGVTYERSRAARQEEASDGGDIYARVYAAERPELFFKAHGSRVVGHLGEVGIRRDSAWNVPEPELALVLNPALEVVGYTIGNDMSSRDIEGANPLYLPQAKIYDSSCALGPAILLDAASTWPEVSIRLDIERAGSLVFSDEVSTARIKRSIEELTGYLGRALSFPQGAVLLTGTGIVPPAEFTLAERDRVRITIDGVGTLINTVRIV